MNIKEEIHRQTFKTIKANQMNLRFKRATGWVVLAAMIGTVGYELWHSHRVDAQNLAILAGIMLANFVSIDISKIREAWRGEEEC